MGGPGGAHDPFDIFQSFFGGGSPFGGKWCIKLFLTVKLSCPGKCNVIKSFSEFFGVQVEAAEVGGKEGERMSFIHSRFLWRTSIMEPQRSCLSREMFCALNAKGQYIVYSCSSNIVCCL